MQLQSLAIDSLNPAPYNPRVALQPGDPDYERLARSLDEFGCVEPLVWNRRTGNLVGGHQRLAVLKARGATEVDVSVVDLPPDKEKALNVALNKITGRWDESALAALLDDLLKTPEFEFDLTGFDVAEARSLIDEFLPPPEGLLGDPDGFDPDALAPPGAEPVTQFGDLLTLGTDSRTSHRLLCGDSTDAECVKRLMDGERAVLFATDPPYLVGYDGTNHPGSGGKAKTTHRGGAGAGGQPRGWGRGQRQGQGLVEQVGRARRLRRVVGRRLGRPGALPGLHRGGRCARAARRRGVVLLAREPAPGHARTGLDRERRVRSLPDHLDQVPLGAHAHVVPLGPRALSLWVEEGPPPASGDKGQTLDGVAAALDLRERRAPGPSDAQAHRGLRDPDAPAHLGSPR